MSDREHISDEELTGTDSTEKVAGAPGVAVVPDDLAAPSKFVSSKRQRLSDIFTIVGQSHCTQRAVSMLIPEPVLRRLCADQRWIPEQPHVSLPPLLGQVRI